MATGGNIHGSIPWATLMKSFIIILFLIASIRSNSQIAQDTITIGTIENIFTAKYAGSVYYKFGTNDTIHVLMLFCDTSVNRSVSWQHGYNVYENKTGPVLTPDGYIYTPSNRHRILASRLDINKQPLSKSIIIWQTINL